VKCHEIKLPVHGEPEHIEIVVFCCAHIGHKNFDRKRFEGWLKWAKQGRNRYVYNLGDDIENAIPGDAVHNSMMWDSNLTPEEQYRQAADYWRPLAEQGKLLATHDSNHFWRSEAATGRSIAKELNVFLQQEGETDPLPDSLPRWGRWQSLSKLRIRKQEYLIHSWHGSGGAATPEGALRRCREQERNHEADVYIMGHFHQPLAWGKEYNRFSQNGMDAKSRQRWFGVTGSFLGWHDSYAERAGYGLNRLGCIVLKLGVERWDVKIVI
jgi:hypothetical protein